MERRDWTEIIQVYSDGDNELDIARLEFVYVDDDDRGLLVV